VITCVRKVDGWSHSSVVVCPWHAQSLSWALFSVSTKGKNKTRSRK
jgi:hypothetical protein